MKFLTLGIAGCFVPSTLGFQAVEISRGITDPQAFFNRNDNRSHCVYDGGHILLSHPTSMGIQDSFYTTSDLMLKASMMTIDRINLERCGVTIGGKNFSLAIKAYADESSKDTTALVTEAIVNKTDFLLAGYSSGLASVQTPIAEENGRLVVTAGSASTSVHAGRRHVFGMLSPGNSYLTNAYRATAEAGAKTIAYLVDDDILVCSPAQATKYGLEILYERFLGDNKTFEMYDEAASNISQLDPDVMVLCTRHAPPSFWVSAARKHDWSPKAQVFWGNFDLEEELGTDAKHILSVASWTPNLPPNPDVVTGWTPESFTSDFEKATSKTPDYRQAAQSAAISVLVQTLEMVGSNNTDELLATLQQSVYPTVYGDISFDENGQNNAANLLLQDDEDLIPQVVYPKELSTGFELVYPMPTWAFRDCTIGKCASTNGECMEDGSCSCPEPLLPIQIGATSSCKSEENMTYIHPTFLYVGYCYVAIQVLVSIFFVGWTVRKQKTEIVKASQPLFLHLINFGCCVLSLSIIPASIQGAYRYQQDPSTMLLTDTVDGSIQNVDIACMAFPWTFGLGFGIVFSALFAKIHRIRAIVYNASRFRRKAVKERHVMHMIAIVLTIESTIILIWTLLDPLEWNREVLSTDEDGLPVQSVGQCQSEYAGIFWLIFIAFNVLVLMYALFLCYATRTYPSELSESRWITACVISYIQILVLAVPILVIVTANNSAYFFVLATVVFLMSMSVTLFIFLPKVYSVHFDPEKPSGERGMGPSRQLHSKLSTATGNRRKSTGQKFYSQGYTNEDSAIKRITMAGYSENSLPLEVIASEDIRTSGAATASDLRDSRLGSSDAEANLQDSKA